MTFTLSLVTNNNNGEIVDHHSSSISLGSVGDSKMLRQGEEQIMSEVENFEPFETNEEPQTPEVSKRWTISKIALIASLAIISVVIITIIALSSSVNLNNNALRPSQISALSHSSQKALSPHPSTTDPGHGSVLAKTPFQFLVHKFRANLFASIGILVGFLVLLSVAITLGIVLSKAGESLTDNSDDTRDIISDDPNVEQEEKGAFWPMNSWWLALLVVAIIVIIFFIKKKSNAYSTSQPNSPSAQSNETQSKALTTKFDQLLKDLIILIYSIHNKGIALQLPSYPHKPLDNHYSTVGNPEYVDDGTLPLFVPDKEKTDKKVPIRQYEFLNLFRFKYIREQSPKPDYSVILVCKNPNLLPTTEFLLTFDYNKDCNDLYFIRFNLLKVEKQYISENLFRYLSKLISSMKRLVKTK